MDKTRGIDFEHLGLRDALDLAVLIEEEAHDRYIELAEQMEAHRTPEAAKFFRFMAGNEAKHQAALYDRRTRIFGTETCQVTRAMLFDIEAPDYDAARAFMTVREGLNAALEAEVKAGAFFAAALPRIADPEVARLFAELRDEEDEHQRLVHAELAKAPADPAIHPSKFSDPPQSVD